MPRCPASNSPRLDAARATLRVAGALLLMILRCALAPTPAAAVGLTLNWDNCIDAGAHPNKVFNCASGPARNLVLNIQPPSFSGLIAVECALYLQTSTPGLDAFWHYETGGCNQTGLNVLVDNATIPGNECLPDINVDLQAIGVYNYIAAYGAPNRARLYVAIARPVGMPVDLISDANYYLGHLRFNFIKAAERGGPCAGCTQPASIVWSSATLYREDNSTVTVAGVGLGSDYVTINGPAITTTAGPGGTISPSGTVPVALGGNQTFTIVPDAVHHVRDVVVDGGSVGAVPNYTFNNVTIDHTISVSFASNVVTNEFLARPAPGRAEFYELLNVSGASLDLDQWTLTVNGVPDTIRSVVLPVGGYYVDSTFVTGPGLFPDHGAVFELRSPGGVLADRVAYGDSGGAPVFAPNPKSVSTARLPNGADTDQDGSDFNAATATTAGPNSGASAATTLGTSVFISRIYMHGGGQDAIEFYNPLPQPLDITGFLLTDGGDNVESTLGVPGTSIGMLQPQQRRWLKQGDPGSFDFDITYDTCLRLYAPGRVPIEYIGWKQVPAYDPDLCVSRTPTSSDGYHNGYDFTTSGGPQYLQFRSCNIVGDRTGVTEPAAELSFAGAVPNPSVSLESTVMAFAVPGSPGGVAQQVRLRLFDVAGRMVGTVVDRAFPPGPHRVSLAGARATTRLSPGAYLAVLDVGGKRISRHVVLLR